MGHVFLSIISSIQLLYFWITEKSEEVLRRTACAPGAQSSKMWRDHPLGAHAPSQRQAYRGCKWRTTGRESRQTFGINHVGLYLELSTECVE